MNYKDTGKRASENHAVKIAKQVQTAAFLVFDSRLKLFIFACFLILSGFLLSAPAQDLPKKIRGYKVYQADISVKNKAKKSSEAVIKIGEPEVADVSVGGLTLEILFEIEALEQSGTVDFLAFHDFQVNGIKVNVEEYKHSFELKKNQNIILPQPARIFVSTGQTLRGALKEWRESKEEWTVTGRVFVFGHFRKAGFKFKRVVPVDINLKIKNPLKTEVDENEEQTLSKIRN
jgi:hypothetical protein